MKKSLNGVYTYLRKNNNPIICSVEECDDKVRVLMTFVSGLKREEIWDKEDVEILIKAKLFIAR